MSTPSHKGLFDHFLLNDLSCDVMIPLLAMSLDDKFCVNRNGGVVGFTRRFSSAWPCLSSAVDRRPQSVVTGSEISVLSAQQLVQDHHVCFVGCK